MHRSCMRTDVDLKATFASTCEGFSLPVSLHDAVLTVANGPVSSAGSSLSRSRQGLRVFLVSGEQVAQLVLHHDGKMVLRRPAEWRQSAKS